MGHATPYEEDISDRKLFLSELIDRFERWTKESAHSPATTQLVIDDVDRLKKRAEPLWCTDATNYTPRQIDLLGDCHVSAYDIQGRIIQLSAASPRQL